MARVPEDTQDQRHSCTTSEGQHSTDTDPQFERDRLKARRQRNKWAWCLPCCWTLTLTDRRRVGQWSHRACAFQEGLFGKAGPEAPAPDGGPPSHAPFGLSGRIWGAAPGLHSTWALLHRHGVTSHPALPRGDLEPHMILGCLGPSTRNPSQSTQSQPAEPVCIHSHTEVYKHLLCARPYLRLRKFRREQNTPRPTQS